MTEKDVPAYDIEFRWKEEIIYWEGRRGYCFDGAWGVTPLVTFVPVEAAWDSVVPAWMRARRAQIVDRLEREDGHVVRADDSYSTEDVHSREVTR